MVTSIPKAWPSTSRHGDFFASTFYNILEERSAAGESTMIGGQVGWKPMVGAAD